MPLAGLSDPFLKIQIKHDYEVDRFFLYKIILKIICYCYCVYRPILHLQMMTMSIKKI